MYQKNLVMRRSHVPALRCLPGLLVLWERPTTESLLNFSGLESPNWIVSNAPTSL